jgi:hypothetical protein
LAPLFVGRSPLFDHYDPDLTLNGLRIIYDRVKGDPADASPPTRDLAAEHLDAG